MACCTICSDICNCLTFKSSDNSILVNVNKALCTWDLIANTTASTLTYNSTTRVLTYTNEHGTITNITLANDLQTLSLTGTNLTLSKSGGTVDLSTILPIFVANSASLVITAGGAHGYNPNIELVPSTDANNILVLGSDGHPYANYGTFAGVSSSLVITAGGTHGLTPHIELVPSIQSGNTLVLGTDGKPYVPATTIPTFAATSTSLVVTPGGTHGFTPDIELVPSTDTNNILVIGTDGHPKVVNNFWQLTGNAGTIAGTNFLGTTDSVDLIFKRNNTLAGILQPLNTSFGVSSLNTTLTGNNNIAFGNGNLSSVTFGTNNTAIGYTNLTSLESGELNIAIGGNSLNSNVSGFGNIAIGDSIMPLTTSGTNNIGIGLSILSNNISGSENLALGNLGLLNLTTGSYNVQLGSYLTSIGNLTTGNYNLLLGTNADVVSGNVSNSIALGYNIQSSSNQLAISSTIHEIYAPGIPTGLGYVLTDVANNGHLTLQPIPSASTLTLTTIGTSGSATLVGTTLNIPTPPAPLTYRQKLETFSASNTGGTVTLSFTPSGDVLLFSPPGLIADQTKYTVSGTTLTYGSGFGTSILVSYIHT